MSDHSSPDTEQALLPLGLVIAALKKGHPILGPDDIDLAAAAWLERLSSVAQSPAADGFVLVPQAALAWLNGEAPDPDGKWFGDDEEVNEQTPTKFYRKYWWRSKFRELCAVSSTDRDTPLMETAKRAAKVVEGWSDAKREYADRTVSRRDSGGSDG